MKRMHTLFYLGLLSGLLIFTGCSDDEDDTGPIGSATLEVQMAEDIPASVDVPRGEPPVYTFYSLTDSRIVSPADSNSTQWDIALAGTTVLINGGTSGPGQAEAQIVNGAFDDLTEAPEDGYQTDSEGGFAIPAGDENGWYNYTSTDSEPNNTVLPLPGKVIVLRTAEGNYAKMEILSYYEGNPDTTTPEFADFATRPASRYYTFQYVAQPNGSRQF
ncbi:MAG: HmuY family protein [Bacteroidota bacterium]